MRRRVLDIAVWRWLVILAAGFAWGMAVAGAFGEVRPAGAPAVGTMTESRVVVSFPRAAP